MRPDWNNHILSDARNGDEARTVPPAVEPAALLLDNGKHHPRVNVVQIRLVGEKAVPVVGVGLGVPLPVGALGIDEHDKGHG